MEACVITSDREMRLTIKIGRTGRKRITVNGVKKRTASELSGILCTVLFCPEDLEIVKGAAAERRKFMDFAIGQLRPKYAAALTEYGRIYDHKTRILRDFKEKPDLLEVLDAFNSKLAKTGAEIIYYRAAWCKKLSAFAASLHKEISGCKESLSLTYKTVGIPEQADAIKPSEIYAFLAEHQRQHRQAEIESGLCLSGAHKDDLEIDINGKPARAFASQGQIRTCALSLKLAEREISFDDKGDYPVLLLDDVLSELDSERQDFLLNKVAGGQVFITCCASEGLEQKPGGRIFRFHAGSAVQQ